MEDTRANVLLQSLCLWASIRTKEDNKGVLIPEGEINPESQHHDKQQEEMHI